MRLIITLSSVRHPFMFFWSRCMEGFCSDRIPRIAACSLKPNWRLPEQLRRIMIAPLQVSPWPIIAGSPANFLLGGFTAEF